MREIKFRAWDEEKKKMYYDISFIPPWGFIRSGYGGSPWADTSKPRIGMQYTGLKDKKDKEIYEGDIVNKNMPTEVIYQKGSYCIWYQGYLFALNEKLSESEIEVIGNKYENPELLEKLT
jgi:hypothetical protein